MTVWPCVTPGDYLVWSDDWDTLKDWCRENDVGVRATNYINMQTNFVVTKNHELFVLRWL